MIDPKALDALYATLSDIEAANQPVEVIEEQQKAPPQKDALVEELLAQNTEELSNMYETMMAGAGEFGTGEYKGPTKKQLGLTPKVIVDEGPQDFMVKEEIVTPDVLKQQVDLEQELEKLPQIKPEPVVAEQSQPIESLGEVVVKPPEKTPENKEQPKAETTGTTYTASSLYNNLKSKDEKIFNDTANYLYDAISKYEWRGQKPIFDFVGVKQGSNVRSSAFGPAQIVSDTVRNELERIAKKYGKDSEEYIFADKLQAAQNLFLNLSDKYRKGKKINEQTAKEVATTKAAIDEDYKFGGAAFKKLGIDKDKFVDYVKEGYFLPSNFKNSKGIPVELLGDNYKENYMKLFKSVLLNKASGDKSLEETLQKYHGHPTDKNQNKTYQEEVFKNLFDTTNPYDKPIEDNETEIEVRPSYQPITKKKQSGGMIESDPYKKQPRFI